MTKLFSATLFFGLLLFAFSSCEKDHRADNEAQIQQYIKDNSLNAIDIGDGLYYVMDVEGTGVQPSGVNSIVTVHYTGRLLNGNTFDSSIGGNPFRSSLTSVIKGWQIGIPYFKKGGIGKLLIPSHLAYGSSGSGSIPANAPIMFDIDLIEVEN